MGSLYDNEKLNCPMVRTFARMYFEGKTAASVTDMLLAHLLKCVECRKLYKELAKREFNIEFDALKAAQNFISQNPREADHKYIRKVLITRYGEEVYYGSRKNFEYAAETYNLDILKRVKSVKDIFEEKYELSEDNVEQIIEFNKYLAKKICKNIDLLERCLKCEQ